MLASSPVNSSPILANNQFGQYMAQQQQQQQQQQTQYAAAASLTPTSGISPLASTTITSAKFITKQDRETLIQYTKHFTRKAVQIIVQSRLGEKKITKSRVNAFNADWVRSHSLTHSLAQSIHH